MRREGRGPGGAHGWPSARAVVATFGSDGIGARWPPISGAWSNRLFRLVVGTEAFAVKELRNPRSDPRWSEWLDAAWSFELAAIGAGVDAPEPVPNPDGGHCLARVERDGQGPLAPVRVHRWVDGEPAEPGPVRCRPMGRPDPGHAARSRRHAIGPEPVPAAEYGHGRRLVGPD